MTLLIIQSTLKRWSSLWGSWLASSSWLSPYAVATAAAVAWDSAPGGLPRNIYAYVSISVCVYTCLLKWLSMFFCRRLRRAPFNDDTKGIYLPTCVYTYILYMWMYQGFCFFCFLSRFETWWWSPVQQVWERVKQLLALPQSAFCFSFALTWWTVLFSKKSNKNRTLLSQRSVEVWKLCFEN